MDSMLLCDYFSLPCRFNFTVLHHVRGIYALNQINQFTHIHTFNHYFQYSCSSNVFYIINGSFVSLIILNSLWWNEFFRDLFEFYFIFCLSICPSISLNLACSYSIADSKSFRIHFAVAKYILCQLVLPDPARLLFHSHRPFHRVHRPCVVCACAMRAV